MYCELAMVANRMGCRREVGGKLLLESLLGLWEKRTRSEWESLAASGVALR